MSGRHVNMDGDEVDVLTWENSGLSPVEIQICRNVAAQYPDGAYAEFVRLLDLQRDTDNRDLLTRVSKKEA